MATPREDLLAQARAALAIREANVSQYGATDATINSWQTAAEFALEAQESAAKAQTLYDQTLDLVNNFPTSPITKEVLKTPTGLTLIGGVDSIDNLVNIVPNSENDRIFLNSFYSGWRTGSGIFIAKKGPITRYPNIPGLFSRVDADWVWVRESALDDKQVTVEQLGIIAGNDLTNTPYNENPGERNANILNTVTNALASRIDLIFGPHYYYIKPGVVKIAQNWMGNIMGCGVRNSILLPSENPSDPDVYLFEAFENYKTTAPLPENPPSAKVPFSWGIKFTNIAINGRRGQGTGSFVCGAFKLNFLAYVQFNNVQIEEFAGSALWLNKVQDSYFYGCNIQASGYSKTDPTNAIRGDNAQTTHPMIFLTSDSAYVDYCNQIVFDKCEIELALRSPFIKIGGSSIGNTFINCHAEVRTGAADMDFIWATGGDFSIANCSCSRFRDLVTHTGFGVVSITGGRLGGGLRKAGGNTNGQFIVSDCQLGDINLSSFGVNSGRPHTFNNVNALDVSCNYVNSLEWTGGSVGSITVSNGVANSSGVNFRGVRVNKINTSSTQTTGNVLYNATAGDHAVINRIEDCYIEGDLTVNSVHSIIEGNIVKGVISNKNRDVIEYTPEQFGAKGDGVANDVAAIRAMFSQIQTLSNPGEGVFNVRFQNKYRVAIEQDDQGVDLPWTPMTFASYCNVYGGGWIHFDNSDKDLAIFETVNKTRFTVKDLTVTRKTMTVHQNGTTLAPANAMEYYATWGCTALHFTTCSVFTVDSCRIHMHTDAIGTTNCSSFELTNNFLYDLGEEPIAVRGGQHVRVEGNELTKHQGDGILLKTGSREAFDILVANNQIHDAHKPTISAGAGHTQRGGGVTLNNEVTGTSYSFSNLTVVNNHIVNTSYGVSLGGISDISVTNNFIKTIERFGIQIDYSSVNNPNKIPTERSRIIGNSIQDTVENGIDYHGSADIAVTETVIANNLLTDCGTSPTTAYNGIAATKATIAGNIINGCKTALFTNECAITGNKISESGLTTSQIWIKLYGGNTIFVGNFVSDTGLGYILFRDGINSIIESNVVKLANPNKAVELIGTFDNTTVIGKNSWDCGFTPILTESGATGDGFMQFESPYADYIVTSPVADLVVPANGSFVLEITSDQANVGDVVKGIKTNKNLGEIYGYVSGVVDSKVAVNFINHTAAAITITGFQVSVRMNAVL